MKKINKYLLLLTTAVFALTACEQDQKREPSPTVGTNVAAFAISADEVDINPAKQTLAYEVALVRSNTDSALSVGIEVLEGDSDIIKVPSSAAFAAGEDEVSLSLSFPNAQIDSSYSIVIGVKSENQSPYIDGASTFSLTVNIAAWEDAATQAVFIDGVMCSPYGLDQVAWYVDYQEKTNADGSKDYRFKNPYRNLEVGAEPDQFGVYSVFPYNESEEEVDFSSDYNWEMHVSADGQVTFPKTYLGLDWGDGAALAWLYADFMAAKSGGDPDYATYGAGSYDATANTITIKAGVMLWYFDGYGGNLTSLDQVVYLDATAYQNDHLLISDYNSSDISWTEQESVVNLFESNIFKFSNEEQKLYKAEDPYEGNPKSPYINLYCLKNAYAAGGNLAFYWDGNDTTITIPAGQNTKLSFMQKELYIAAGTGDVVTNNVKGTDVKVFTFNLSVVAEDGTTVGDYTETFSMANENIVFEKSDFIGSFVLSGADPWDGSALTENVTIAESGDSLLITGITYTSGLVGTFDAETGVLSIGAQGQDSIGAYDIAFVTDGETDEATIDLAFGLSGVAKVTATSEATGFYLVSEAAGGAVYGMADLKLTPAASPAPSKAAKAPSYKGSKQEGSKMIRHNKPTTDHLSFKGMYDAHKIKGEAILF